MVDTIPDILITIPVYNEIQRITLVKQFSSELITTLMQINTNIAVVFVDDGSIDGTPDIIQKWVDILKLENKGLYIDILRLSSNTKKSGMYQSALSYKYAYNYLFVDADACFQTDDILQCIELIDQHDIIITYKQAHDNRHVFRRLITYVHNKMTEIIFAGKIKDTQTGLKIFSRDAATSTFPYIHPWHGFASDFVLIYKAYLFNLDIHQISVEPIHRGGSHVQLLRDSLRHLFVVSLVISSYYVNKLYAQLKKAQ